MAPRPTFGSLLPAVLAGQHTLVTEGGTETQLIFLRSIELPNFCAFEAAVRDEWRPILMEVYQEYVDLAPDSAAVTMMLDSPTWRASRDHMKSIGRSGTDEDVAEVNAACVRVMQELRERAEAERGASFLIGGQVGPRGDGYKVEGAMTADEAADFHFTQVQALASAGVDVVNALTMAYVDEAIGVARAAARAAIPCVISFTVETDGRLPDGATHLLEAVQRVEEALADGVPPAFYMVNCAHPTHVAPALAGAASSPVARRILGFRANASSKSHAELDEATELDDGCPEEFGAAMAAMAERAGLGVLGGCCGTDTRHVKELLKRLAAAQQEEE